MSSIATGYAFYPRNDKVFDCFDAIANTAKRTEKHDALLSLAKSKALYTLLYLVFGRDKFYVTAKSVEYTGKASATKQRFASTDEAVSAFLEITWKLANNKLSGNAAKEKLNEFFAAVKKSKNVHASTHKWLLAVLDKNLRIGIDTSVQDIFPDMIEAFGIPKGLALIEQKSGKRVARAVKMISFPCDVEPKKDGFNISFVCDIDAKTVKAVSSDNEELPALRPYALLVLKALLKLKQENAIPKQYANQRVIVIDGEVESDYNIARREDTENWKSSWGKTSALCKAGIKKTGYDAASIDPIIQEMIYRDLFFTFYEAYPNSAHKKMFECKRIIRRKFFTAVANAITSLKYCVNKVDVVRFGSFRAIAYKVCRNEKELEATHVKNVNDGEEGSIIRMPEVGVLADSKWRGNFVKYKEYSKEDAVILGVVEGTGRNAGSAGSFWAYLPARKQFTKVTVLSDAIKAWIWKHRDVVHGFGIEVVGAKDKTGEANASRNPVLARFRHDQLPMDLKSVQKLCVKAKIAVPEKDNMSTKLFSKAMAAMAV